MNFYDVILAGKLQDVTYPANFFDLLFVRKLYPADVWEIYEGTLPATFTASGDDMRQYQVWGNTGGVGDKTANFLSVPDFIENAEYSSLNPSRNVKYVEFQGEPNTQYTIGTNFYGTQTACWFLALPNTAPSSESNGCTSINPTRLITTGNDGKFWVWGRFSLSADAKPITIMTSNDYVMLVQGSTSPASFVPYGYEVDMSVSDGANSTTTPIYIGDTALQKDEYVDYKAGKVYRFGDDVFTHEGETSGKYINSRGQETLITSSPWFISNYIPVSADTKYKFLIDSLPGAAARHAFYTSERSLISVIDSGSQTFVTPENCAYMRFSYRGDSLATLQPLQPTDPPVALPALPTCEGTTIVDYAGTKTETTKNILPSAQAQTLTVNGNTCTCDGQGRYHVDMNNNTDTNFVFGIPEFTIPVSVGQGGGGTWSMFNTASQSMQVKLYYNDTEIDYWSVNAANRTSDSYSSMGGKTINKIIINAWNASVDGDFAFMFTDNGVLPSEFVPHEIAKPTPEKVLFEYKKG